ncbi:MAG: Dickkopf N-terminal cysteine-rich domain-containing protein [Myxococcota bacterium]
MPTLIARSLLLLTALPPIACGGDDVGSAVDTSTTDAAADTSDGDAHDATTAPDATASDDTTTDAAADGDAAADVGPDAVDPDADPCAGVDCSALDRACAVGVCVPTTGACTTLVRDDAAPCDDGDRCTRDDTCTAGTCSGRIVDCGGADDLAHCAIGVCDPATGACTTGPAPIGRACGEGRSCDRDGCVDAPPLAFSCQVDPAPIAAGSPERWCSEPAGGLCLGSPMDADLGREYASAPCASDDDCAFPDGAEGSCLTIEVEVERWRDGARVTETVAGDYCVKTCLHHDCTGEGLCLTPSATYDVEVPVCVDLLYDTCMLGIGASTKCITPGDTCQLASGGHDITPLCYPSNGGAPLGTPCTAPGTGDAQPCVTSLQCQASGWSCVDGFCQPPWESRCGSMCTLGVCSEPCVVDGDCPSDMYCAGLALPMPVVDVLLRYGSCMPAAGSHAACTTDDDCAGGERCGWFPGVTADRTFCYAPSGDVAEAGDRCDVPCASNLCLAGANTCSALCASDDDCGDGLECEALVFGRGPTPPRMCVPAATCRRDADCAAGAVCHVAFRPDGSARNFCAPPAGALGPGEACDPAAVITGPVPFAGVCATGFCGDDGRCPEPCATSTDCARDALCRAVPERPSARATPLDPGDDFVVAMQRCVPVIGSQEPCRADAECATPGEVCRLETDRTGGVVTRCGPPSGALGQGATCRRDAQPACASAICASAVGALDGACAAPCRDDDDCVGGAVCRAVGVGPGDAHEVMACVAPDTDLCAGYRPVRHGAAVVDGAPWSDGWQLATDADGARSLSATREHALSLTIAEGRTWRFVAELGPDTSVTIPPDPPGALRRCLSLRWVDGQYQSGAGLADRLGRDLPSQGVCRNVVYLPAGEDGPVTLYLDPGLTQPLDPGFASLNDWQTSASYVWDLTTGALRAQGSRLILP